MLNADNFTTFLPIFPFQILFKVQEKSESFEGFFGGKNIFCKTYARDTQSAIRHIFEFFCPCLLVGVAAKICEPISESRKIQKYDEWTDWVFRA